MPDTTRRDVELALERYTSQALVYTALLAIWECLMPYTDPVGYGGG
jgi:hypothetical protein